MPDYSIFIDEQDFLARPIHELSKLQLLSEAFIREKLTSLNYAQRCLFAAIMCNGTQIKIYVNRCEQKLCTIVRSF